MDGLLLRAAFAGLAMASTCATGTASPVDMALQARPEADTASAGVRFVADRGAEPRGLVPLYSNIRYDLPKARYLWQLGYNVDGDQGDGLHIWLAVPFTPKHSSVVHEVDVAVNWDGSGPRSFVLGLATDSAGLPGDVLASHVVKKLPDFGTCCRLTRVYDATGVPVVGGRTYWITVTTDDRQAGLFADWCQNDAVKGPFGGAWDRGSGWGRTVYPQAPAFAVWGD